MKPEALGHERAVAPDQFAPLVEKLLNDLNCGFVSNTYDDIDGVTNFVYYSKYQAVLRKKGAYYLIRLLVSRGEYQHRTLQVFELRKKPSRHRNIRILTFPEHKRFGALGENEKFEGYMDADIRNSRLFLSDSDKQLHLYQLFVDASSAQFDPDATRDLFKKQLMWNQDRNGHVTHWLNPSFRN